MSGWAEFRTSVASRLASLFTFSVGTKDGRGESESLAEAGGDPEEELWVRGDLRGSQRSACHTSTAHLSPAPASNAQQEAGEEAKSLDSRVDGDGEWLRVNEEEGDDDLGKTEQQQQACQCLPAFESPTPRHLRKGLQLWVKVKST